MARGWGRSPHTPLYPSERVYLQSEIREIIRGFCFLLTFFENYDIIRVSIKIQEEILCLTHL